MNEMARRYNDEDLRRDPNLVGIAIRYARDYRGDFEFLTAARDLVNDTGVLPLAVARAVLNCMRTDPRAFIYKPSPTETPLAPATVTPIRPNNPKVWVKDFPVRYKALYGVARMGKVLHRIDNEKSVCRWQRSSDDAPLRPVRLYLYWKCENYTPYEPSALYDEIPYNVPPCRSGCWEPGETAVLRAVQESERIVKVFSE